MPPIIKNQHLILRPLNPVDLISYQKNFNDYDIIRYLASFIPWPYPENGVEDYYYNILTPKQGKDYWHWGIFLKENPSETIGAIDLWRGNDVDNRGFWLAKKHWSKGFMTEVAIAVNDYAFNELGFEILFFGNALTNIGSRRIKEKTGAIYIGKRPFKFVDTSIQELESWKLTKEAWLKFKNKSSS